MGDIFWRFAWFVIVASAISYASYLLVGSMVNAHASKNTSPVTIRDELGRGAHYLTGMLMVPTPCDELVMRTEAVSSSTYMLLFQTWREPSIRNCPPDETPRPFHAVLFAPAAGVDFAATLNGVGLPIVVLPEIKKD